MFKRMFEDKRKFFGTILGIIIFIITALSITYAFYNWKSSDTPVTFNISDSYFFCETNIETNINSLVPDSNGNYKNGTYQAFVVNNIGRRDTTFSVSLNVQAISDVLKHESFKYKLLLDPTGGSKDCSSPSETGCTTNSAWEGDFSDVHVGMNTLIPSINLSEISVFSTLSSSIFRDIISL